jgi:hypothetical protein
MSEKKQTFGERAVGLSFNPSADSSVDEIKKECAQIIDTLNTLREQATDLEVKRMYSISITEVQTGQMWAVKLLHG